MTTRRYSGVQVFRCSGVQERSAQTPEHLSPAFTLIELLMAMTLLAIISAGMAMAFSTSLKAAAAIQQRANVGDERRKVIAQMREDLQGVWLRSGSQTTWFRGGDLSTDPNVAASTTSPGEGIPAQGDSLELTTMRPISLDALQAGEQGEGTFGPQSDVAEVLWRLEPDQDGTLALVRRERTPPDATIDPTQDPTVVRTVMSRSVTGMQVYCYDGTQWLEQWDAALPPQDTNPAGTGQSSTTTAGAASSAPAGLPQAVQLVLTFAPDAASPQGLQRSQPSSQALPVTIMVPMPGAEEQVLHEQSTQGTGVGG